MTIHQNLGIDYRSLCYPNRAKFKKFTGYLLIAFIGHDRTKVLKIWFPDIQCEREVFSLPLQTRKNSCLKYMVIPISVWSKAGAQCQWSEEQASKYCHKETTIPYSILKSETPMKMSLLMYIS